MYYRRMHLLLTYLLVVAGAAISGGNYGVVVKGKLIPEVVKRGSLEIGRFEVTRAQYFAWDNGYSFPKGTENFPANGITPPQAKAYAEWLSSLTGEVWRLPNEDEVAELYKDSRGENVGTGELKEVGSGPSRGGLYDLGGNVAEWVITKDGKAKTLGGSAERLEKYNNARNWDFTGFRVVRGKPQ